jgi:hypothetical protein
MELFLFEFFPPRAETGCWDSYALDINVCSDILLCIPSNVVLSVTP